MPVILERLMQGNHEYRFVALTAATNYPVVLMTNMMPPIDMIHQRTDSVAAMRPLRVRALLSSAVSTTSGMRQNLARSTRYPAECEILAESAL